MPVTPLISIVLCLTADTSNALNITLTGLVSLSEFVNQLSRGKLSHPPSYLYDLGLYLLAYYKHVKDKTCVNRILIGFKEIHIATHIDIPNSDSVLRRFVNTFTRAFAKNETENIAKEKKQNVVKRKRLER